jgi:hypothetical protein
MCRELHWTVSQRMRQIATIVRHASIAVQGRANLPIKGLLHLG